MIPDKSDIAIQNANAVIHQIENGEQWQPMPEDDADKFTTVLTQWLAVNGRRPKPSLKNPMAVDQVRQANQYYQNILIQNEMAQQAQMAPSGPPGSKPGGPPAPGGTPKSSGAASGTDTNQSAIGANAQGLVQQADKAGDAQTLPGRAHES